MPWCAPVPVHRRRPQPSGFILPCQPKLVAMPAEGPLWQCEVKYAAPCALGLEGMSQSGWTSPNRSERALTWPETKCEGYERA